MCVQLFVLMFHVIHSTRCAAFEFCGSLCNFNGKGKVAAVESKKCTPWYGDTCVNKHHAVNCFLIFEAKFSMM